MPHDIADVVILGAGSGGYAAAIRSAELGKSVVLIEEREIGGTCLHRGCIPTKALLHTAEVADSARSAAKVGVRVSGVEVDAGQGQSFKERIVQRLHKGLSGLIASHDITVVHGRGRLISDTEVDVDGTVITGKHLIVATGSTPKLIPAAGIGGRVLTSEGALELDTVPDSVIVLGGGVIGTEFASLWTSFGASVTVVEAMPRLLPTEDEEISARLEKAFRRRKIAIRTSTRMSTVVQDDDGVTVTLDGGEALRASIVLVALGRGPNTGFIGLADVGIELEQDFVIVDDHLRTSVTNIYAVGDITRGPQLAHRGFAQGIFAAEHIAGRHPDVVDVNGIPRITYSQPEVASVGLTEAQAKVTRGDGVRSFTYDLTGNGKSQILGTSGAVKVVTDPDGTVIGVHMIGDRVGELTGQAQIMYNLGIKADVAARFINAHPTQSEGLSEALMAISGKPLHVHP